MFSDYFIISLKNMKNRRLRSFLTLVGIMISIATIFVLVSVSLGLEAAIQDQFEELGGDKFFIQPRGQFGPPNSAAAATLTIADVEEVEDVTGVSEVTRWVLGNAKIDYKDTLRFVIVSSIEPEKQDVALGGFDLDEGRFLRDSDENKILVGSQYKYNNYLGQSVTVGDDVLINDVEFEIVGVFESLGNPADDRTVYMPEDTFRVLFDIPQRVDVIIVQVQDEDNIQAVAESTERKLMRFRDVDEKTKDFTILTPEELLATFGTVLNIVTYFLFAIAAISLLVGGINIANTMFTSVIERTREIGVMKAIGAKNSDILIIFLIEAGVLGLIGGTLGVLLGLGIAKTIEYVAVNQLATSLLQTATPLYLFAICLGFAFIAGAASGLYPAWKATKIRPVEALRYE